MSQKRTSTQTHQRLPALPLEELQGLSEMAAAGTAAGFSKKTVPPAIKTIPIFQFLSLSGFSREKFYRQVSKL